MKGTNKVATKRGAATPKNLTKIAAGMTLIALSKKTGLTVACLSYIFNGERPGKVETLGKIAKALKKSPGELLDYLAKIRARNRRAKDKVKARGRMAYGVARRT
jgi:transcriptional regulator with XRE-family HTH domain